MGSLVVGGGHWVSRLLSGFGNNNVEISVFSRTKYIFFFLKMMAFTLNHLLLLWPIRES